MEDIKTEETKEACGCSAEEDKKASKKCSKKEAEKALFEEIEKLKEEIKEKDATYEVALSDTVSEFLPMIDNLERAAFFDDAEKVKEGLVMIAKSVEAVFAKLGVEEVGKVGEKFDPNLHNAVMHIDDDSYGEGEIVEVFQKGYKKGGRIIRFAMVKTAN